MDFKSFREPTHSAAELALARASTQARTPRLVHSATKPARVLEPVSRSEIWKKFHAGAIREGHPEPERFADAAVRERETALRKKEKRAKVQLLSDPPKPPVDMGSRTVAKTPGPRCQAKTLEGRQCGFAATCGAFCKKHAPQPVFQLVNEPRRFANVRLKGFVNAQPTAVRKMLGKPNGPPSDLIESEWRFVFSDGVPATIFFKRGDDPALHVCGEDITVIGRVRQLLAL